MTRSALCTCGHWEDAHHECADEPCPHNFDRWHVICICGCDNFQTDNAAMRDLENEAKQLEWDARHGK